MRNKVTSSLDEDDFLNNECNEFEDIEEFRRYYDIEKWKLDLDNIVSTRISTFKEYEFTHSIVYELASRNFLVIKLKKIIDDLTILCHQVFLRIDLVEEKRLINEMKLICESFIPSDKIDNFLLELKEDITIYEKIGYIKNKIQSLLYHELYVAYPDYLYSEMYYTGEINEDSESMQFITDENFINRIVFEDDKELEIFIDKIKNDKNYCYNYKSCDDFVLYQGQNINHNEFINDNNINSWSINTIYPDYTKKLKNINHTKISMNLSLPINELISFLKKVKEEYDENNALFSKLGDIQYSKKIPFTKHKQNWSDMFFIYDYISSNHKEKSQKDCIKELQIFFTLKYAKSTQNKNTDNETIIYSYSSTSRTIETKYRIMRELIEEFNYMHLLNRNPRNDILRSLKIKKDKKDKKDKNKTSDLYKKNEKIYDYLKSL